jgi:hypothetical protein
MKPLNIENWSGRVQSLIPPGGLLGIISAGLIAGHAGSATAFTGCNWGLLNLKLNWRIYEKH